MKVELLGRDRDTSFFSSLINNVHNVKKALPSRAYKKTFQRFYDAYLNEVLIRVDKQDLPANKKGYAEFSKTIEAELNKKVIKDKINLITFFGNRDVTLEELIKFEDVGLLTDFEQRFNDHFVSFPFTLKFRDKSFTTDKMLQSLSVNFKDYVSTLKTSNILGYVPAYVSHRGVEDFLKLYSDIGFTTTDADGSKVNFIPLMIDLKNSSPDNFKRTLSKLRILKEEYLKNGDYLFYYGFSIGSPRASLKKPNPVASDFLLSYLGFDVMGATHARLPGGGSSKKPIKAAGVFRQGDFSYHYSELSASDYRLVKMENLSSQTKVLNLISSELQTKSKTASNELAARKDAQSYVKSYS